MVQHEKEKRKVREIIAKKKRKQKQLVKLNIKNESQIK